jgi:hypothetical protein
MSNLSSGRSRSGRPPSTSVPEVDAAASRLQPSVALTTLSRPRIRTLLSMPLAYPSTLERRAQLRDCGFTVLRGGALEPGALLIAENCKLKRTVFHGLLLLRSAQRGLSLSGGASSPSRFSQMSITFLKSRELRSETTKATRWVALASFALWLKD